MHAPRANHAMFAAPLAGAGARGAGQAAEPVQHREGREDHQHHNNRSVLAGNTAISPCLNHAGGGVIFSLPPAGHSLGGALASICAFDIAWSGINRLGDKQAGNFIPVTAFTFEAPRVGEPLFLCAWHAQLAARNTLQLSWRLTAGNLAYAKAFGSSDPDVVSNGADLPPPVLDLKMLRIVNEPDIVPKVRCIAMCFEPCAASSHRLTACMARRTLMSGSSKVPPMTGQCCCRAQAPYLPWSLKYLLPWRWWQAIKFVAGAGGELFRPAGDGSKRGYMHGGKL